jgi:adducin
MQGNVMELGTTNYGVNMATFQLHAAIYAARPDLKAIIDVQVYVSSFKC